MSNPFKCPKCGAILSGLHHCNQHIDSAALEWVQLWFGMFWIFALAIVAKVIVGIFRQ